MPGPWIPIERWKIAHDAGPERVEMDVADEFEEIRLLFHHGGFVTVLEEMAGAVVPAVEGAGVSGEERPHGPREGAVACADQQVKMIREESPGVHTEPGVLDHGGEAATKVRPISVVPEDTLAVEPPHHHVVQDAGRIEAGAAGHARQDSKERKRRQRPLTGERWDQRDPAEAPVGAGAAASEACRTTR